MMVPVATILTIHDDAPVRWRGAAVENEPLRAVLPAAAGNAQLRPAPPAADGDAPLRAAPPAADATLPALVEAQHFANFTIWGLEDEARRRDVGDARIAAVKRAIDPWNQRRNDLMEAIDAAILAHLANVDVQSAQLHSETAGMIIDRLSILALKIHSMERIAGDAAAQSEVALAAECATRTQVLRAQREDLAGCLARLLEDFAAGRRYFKTYRQLKAYNDERLNPALRAAARGGAGQQ
ncbi:MAG: DUF4254 domain-containing protein [Candidatus Binatia bacterium]